MSDQPDVLVVGAGFAGMYAVHRFRELGLSVKALEAGSDVGGTWYWNRYPGARCDVPSLEYSYGFSRELEQEWDWPEVFSAQEDILRYANHVADKFDLRRDMQFNTRIANIEWQDDTRRWRLTSEAGETFEAPFCVMATGCLSVPVEPKIPGAERFRGEVYHTGRWPHEPVDLAWQTRWRHRHRFVRRTDDSRTRAPVRTSHGVPAHAGVHGPGKPQAHARRGAAGVPRQLPADPRDAAEESRRHLELPAAQKRAARRQRAGRRHAAERYHAPSDAAVPNRMLDLTPEQRAQVMERFGLGALLAFRDVYSNTRS